MVAIRLDEAPLLAEEARPVRTLLRQFIAPIVEGRDEIDQSDLISQAFFYFHDDEEFLQAALRDLIPTLVPEILATLVHERKKQFIRTPSGFIGRERLETTARERLAKVFEGSGGSYRSLLTLNRPQLLDLNARDQRQIDSMGKWIGLRSDLAARLKDDQVVGDLSSRVLESTWNRHIGSD